ncbi:hypothetical protein RJ641_007168 [Dillenia turbinata]|uniref:Translocon-associated protein subunit beta n=1 Tax=Dillenia turbinata TaxID=194707 RepID=A0AAN8Z8D5_9MAGN
MANPIVSSLVFVLISLYVVSSAIASSDTPFVVAHKKASLTRLKTGAERVTVTIDIYNQGSSTVYDVSLSDDGWDKAIFDVTGANTSKSWERLDGGASVSHSFELESKVKGMYYGAPAVITFRVPTKAALQVAYSTPILPLDILADRVPEDKLQLVSFSSNHPAKRLLGKYGPLVSVITLIGLFVHLITSPSKSSAAKGSKKRR